MVAIAEIKAVIPLADPHNYDEETKEFNPPKVEVPEPQAEKV
jgi:molybdopterin-containing oxidoreductase family membrane subunit